MTLSTTFANTAKAALVAGLMAIMGMAAAPAQAATSSLTFSFGSAATHNGVVLRFSNGKFVNNYCLTTSEVRSALRAKGFKNVSIIRSLSKHRVVAVGQKNSRWYQLTVNTCTGQVQQERIYRRSNGTFSFTINLGGFGGNGGGGNGGGGTQNEELVCLVTFYDESQVAAGADADVERARVLPRSVAEGLDGPNDRRAIFDYGTDAQTTQTCNYLDQLN
ncbi:MAG: hypothetical protein ABIO40_02550 [Devosia sp.]